MSQTHTQELDEARYARLLRANAGRYFPDLTGNTSVRLVRKSQRLNSALFEFGLGDRGVDHRVIVKVPFVSRDVSKITRPAEAPPDRPRMFPKAPAQEKGLWEYQALTDIHTHFTQLRDPKFGTVRLLDLIEPSYVLIMEKNPDTGLKRLLRKSNRIHQVLPQRRLHTVFSHVGQWLREFHRLPGRAHVGTRNRRRDDFHETQQRFTNYLARSTGQTAFFSRVSDVLSEVADEVLPDELPLALGHGDYAPRNVLVDPRDRVTVFDTLGSWHAPVFEDLGHFVLALHVSGAQASTLGWWCSEDLLSEYEQAFVRGYFPAGPIPWRAIRLFECVLTLERWGALVYRHQEARGPRRIVKASRSLVWGRFLTSYVSRLLRQLRDDPTDVGVCSLSTSPISTPEETIDERTAVHGAGTAH